MPDEERKRELCLSCETKEKEKDESNVGRLTIPLFSVTYFLPAAQTQGEEEESTLEELKTKSRKMNL